MQNYVVKKFVSCLCCCFVYKLLFVYFTTLIHFVVFTLFFFKYLEQQFLWKNKPRPTPTNTQTNKNCKLCARLSKAGVAEFRIAKRRCRRRQRRWRRVSARQSHHPTHTVRMTGHRMQD